jgi:hypothetical protein
MRMPTVKVPVNKAFRRLKGQILYEIVQFMFAVAQIAKKKMRGIEIVFLSCSSFLRV